MEPDRLGVKCFVENAASAELLEFIPIFHRWIQTRALDDLLIDVADYSHMHAGPGILLVAHEGNYGLDETGHRRGLVYYSKRELEGSLSERLTTVCKKVLKACERLEREPEMQGRLKFRGDELQVFANDRLLAPNSDETWAVFEPELRVLLSRLYPSAEYSLSREPDPKERFSVTIKASAPVEIGTLLQRLTS